MNRQLFTPFAALSLVLTAALALPALAGEPAKGTKATTPAKAASTADPAKPKIENLLKTKLGRVENTEVILSRVTLPPNAALPTHWHPGEEFAYMIEGQATVKLKGKKAIVVKAGEAGQVPLKHVHSAKAGPEGAVILVFRVHESGQPERVMVK
jgi:quercetin dioxygenase-like cupin family protein